MISFCIPSKNNLRYLKNSVLSIRKNSHYPDNEIIVYVDEDNDGTTEWCVKNNVTYLKNKDDEPKGIAYGYNRCIEKATKDYVCMFHADMYMAKDFDKNIVKHLKPNHRAVIAGTRIEPPLNPEGKEKIVKGFGMYPEDFDEQAFNDYVDKLLIENKDKLTVGIFAPWAIRRKEIIRMGMHDINFHSYHEDSDIFNRFVINDYMLIQTWESYVYHLTCRGGQFQDGVEKVTSDTKFHDMTSKARKYYLKKWGAWIKNDEYHYPLVSPVFSKSLIVNNPTPQTDQVKDWFNDGKDVIVTIDGNNFNQQDFDYINSLNLIIDDSGDVGKFQLGNVNIEIKKINDHSKSLVKNLDI